MKNWFVKFLLCVAFLAVASHAQLVENPEPYTSGAPAPKTPTMNINHVESDEPMFAVEVHPISLLFNPLIWSNETVMFTVEGNINSNASIITRPFYKGEKISKKHEKGYVDVFGLSEGFRYYFDRGHKGWYTAAHFTFEYVSLMHSYDDSKYDRVKTLETESNWAFTWGIGSVTVAILSPLSMSVLSIARFSLAKMVKMT